MPALKILNDPSEGTSAFDYPVGPGTITRIAIFPPIGIARVGDSDIECFLAPEVPGHTSPPVDKFRDANQKLRRQAVRFRVYAYNKDELLGELNSKNGYTLTWTVDVANKKAANSVFQLGGRFDPSDTALRNPKVQPNVGLEDRSKLIVKANGKIPQLDFFPLQWGQFQGSQDTPVEFVPLRGHFQGSQSTSMEIELAQLQIDNAGRLVFVPGKGEARSVANSSKPYPPITSEFDSIDWIDEICDGSVSVEVKKGDTKITTSPPLTAWVLSAPPNFAWGINAPTTLHDIMENIYYEANNSQVPTPTTANLDFWKHIWPVLLSASSISWTNNTALQGHGSFSNGYFSADSLFELFKGAAPAGSKTEAKRKDFKSRIFEKLRKPLDDANPDNTQANVRYMPRLSGDADDMVDPGTFPPHLQPDARRYAALTKLQYKRFKIWKEDEGFYLDDDDGPPIPESKLEDIELSEQPEELTRTILESAIGDPLYPGIEMYWIAKLDTTYDTTVTINPPFRIRNSRNSKNSKNSPDPILPGHLTRGLSLPWQCDFDQCETHWWPSIRPDDVVPKVFFDATIQNSKVKEEFNTAITTRTKWKRGLRETIWVSDYQTDWPGSDDMVRYWKYLGIVREVEDAFTDENSETYTAFLEDERVWV